MPAAAAPLRPRRRGAGPVATAADGRFCQVATPRKRQCDLRLPPTPRQIRPPLAKPRRHSPQPVPAAALLHRSDQRACPSLTLAAAIAADAGKDEHGEDRRSRPPAPRRTKPPSTDPATGRPISPPPTRLRDQPGRRSRDCCGARRARQAPGHRHRPPRPARAARGAGSARSWRAPRGSRTATTQTAAAAPPPARSRSRRRRFRLRRHRPRRRSRRHRRAPLPQIRFRRRCRPRPRCKVPPRPPPRHDRPGRREGVRRTTTTSTQDDDFPGLGDDAIGRPCPYHQLLRHEHEPADGFAGLGAAGTGTSRRCPLLLRPAQMLAIATTSRPMTARAMPARAIPARRPPPIRRHRTSHGWDRRRPALAVQTPGRRQSRQLPCRVPPTALASASMHKAAVTIDISAAALAQASSFEAPAATRVRQRHRLVSGQTAAAPGSTAASAATQGRLLRPEHPGNTAGGAGRNGDHAQYRRRRPELHHAAQPGKAGRGRGQAERRCQGPRHGEFRRRPARDAGAAAPGCASPGQVAERCRGQRRCRLAQFQPAQFRRQLDFAEAQERRSGSGQNLRDSFYGNAADSTAETPQTAYQNAGTSRLYDIRA